MANLLNLSWFSLNHNAPPYRNIQRKIQEIVAKLAKHEYRTLSARRSLVKKLLQGLWILQCVVSPSRPVAQRPRVQFSLTRLWIPSRLSDLQRKFADLDVLARCCSLLSEKGCGSARVTSSALCSHFFIVIIALIRFDFALTFWLSTNVSPTLFDMLEKGFTEDATIKWLCEDVSCAIKLKECNNRVHLSLVSVSFARISASCCAVVTLKKKIARMQIDSAKKPVQANSVS